MIIEQTVIETDLPATAAANFERAAIDVDDTERVVSSPTWAEHFIMKYLLPKLKD